LQFTANQGNFNKTTSAALVFSSLFQRRNLIFWCS
jgi:hypothetical protein